MGYDMRLEAAPAGEAERVARIRDLFYAACQLRSELPEHERGQLTREQINAGDLDSPPANASTRYKACQAAVSSLYDLMGVEDTSYFRLNIWAMGTYAEIMCALGMAYQSTSPGFPRPDEIKPPGTDDTLWWGCVHHHEEAEAPPEEASDELMDAAREYAQRCEAARRHHPDGGDVIPLHKLGTNDAWLVTADECKQALAAYDALPSDRRDAVLCRIIGAGEGRRDYWDKWIGYLRLAVDHGGFRVN